MESNEAPKSTIELLSEFAANSHRAIHFTENAYPTSTAERVVHHKRTVYMANNAHETSFLVGYNDPKNFGANELHFGVFAPLDRFQAYTFSARKKDLLDRLNPFLRKKTITSGIDYYDQMLIISGNDEGAVRKILGMNGLVNHISESIEMRNAINIGLNACFIEFVPAFKDKSSFGIFTRQEWIMDHEIIEQMFKKVEAMRKIINNE